MTKANELKSGNGLPESRQAAVQQGLHFFQETAAERDQLATEVQRLRADIAGHKVAIEAMEVQLLDAQSRVSSATIIRDQANADRAKWESLFISMYAQMRAFNVPAAPLVREANPNEPAQI